MTGYKDDEFSGCIKLILFQKIQRSNLKQPIFVYNIYFWIANKLFTVYLDSFVTGNCMNEFWLQAKNIIPIAIFETYLLFKKWHVLNLQITIKVF